MCYIETAVRVLDSFLPASIWHTMPYATNSKLNLPFSTVAIPRALGSPHSGILSERGAEQYRILLLEYSSLAPTPPGADS